MLNVKFVARLHPDGEAPEFITAVNATGKQLSKCDSLKPFAGLLRLDLSDNMFSDLGGLSASTSLKWLSLARNQLTVLPQLDIPELQVLNVGSNKLSGKLRVKGVPKLRALIANDNEITTVKGLGRLPELNTLVLKNNSITELSDSLRGCSALEKLSLAHNEISDLADSLATLSQLQELRVGHNDLPRLPSQLSANTRLKIVDVGGNPIRSIDNIKVLSTLPLLQQLSTKGCQLAASNPKTAADADVQPNVDATEAEILKAIPLVEVLNGRRVRQRIRGRVPALDSTPGQGASHTGRAQATLERSDMAPDQHTGSAQNGVANNGEPAASAAKASVKRKAKDARQTQQQQQQQHQSHKNPPQQASQSQQALSSKLRQQRGQQQKVASQPAVTAEDSDSDEAVGDPDVDKNRSFLEEVLNEGGHTPPQGKNTDTAPSQAKRRKTKARHVAPSQSGLLAIIPAAGSHQQAAVEHTAKRKNQAKSSKGVTAQGPKQGEADRAAALDHMLTGSAVAKLLSSGPGLMPQIGTGTGGGWDDNGSAPTAPGAVQPMVAEQTPKQKKQKADKVPKKDAKDRAKGQHKAKGDSVQSQSASKQARKSKADGQQPQGSDIAEVNNSLAKGNSGDTARPQKKRKKLQTKSHTG